MSRLIPELSPKGSNPQWKWMSLIYKDEILPTRQSEQVWGNIHRAGVCACLTMEIDSAQHGRPVQGWIEAKRWCFLRKNELQMLTILAAKCFSFLHVMCNGHLKFMSARSGKTQALRLILMLCLFKGCGDIKVCLNANYVITKTESLIASKCGHFEFPKFIIIGCTASKWRPMQLMLLIHTNKKSKLIQRKVR